MHKAWWLDWFFLEGQAGTCMSCWGNLNFRELSLESVFPVSRIFSSFLPGYNPAISSVQAKSGWREGWEFHNEASLLLITIPWCLPIQSKSDSVSLEQTYSVSCLCSMRRDSMSISVRIGFDNNTEISVALMFVSQSLEFHTGTVPSPPESRHGLLGKDLEQPFHPLPFGRVAVVLECVLYQVAQASIQLSWSHQVILFSLCQQLV